MALSANVDVDRKDGNLIAIPVLSSITVYKGAIVGLSSGYARGLVAADVFMGIAYEKVDNSSGSSGDKSVRCWQRGVFLLTGASFTQATVGSKIYASADGTITTTAGSNTLIGRCVGYESATQVWVAIDVVRESI